MPVRKIVKKKTDMSESLPLSLPLSLPHHLSSGSGITAGLEMWRLGPSIVLYDRSPDSRFADDVERWNTAVGLNAACALLLKDAADKDTA